MSVRHFLSPAVLRGTPATLTPGEICTDLENRAKLYDIIDSTANPETIPVTPE